MVNIKETFFFAAGLVLIIEGILPFLIPKQWRQILKTLSKQPDAHLRVIGLLMMLLGLGVITLARFLTS